MRELNIKKQKELNYELAADKSCERDETESKVLRIYRILNQPGKKNPFMVSTHYEPITLMLTKRKLISGFAAQG